MKNSLIRAQKSNWHNRSWCRNLSLAFKHEPVHFLVAKNFVINHLLLEALPADQTVVATARPWSLCSFVPYTVSPGQEERLQSLSYETWTKCCYFSFLQYAILLTIVVTIQMKYVLHIIDLRSENPWDNKAVYLLYTELITGNNTLHESCVLWTFNICRFCSPVKLYFMDTHCIQTPHYYG